MTRSAAVSRRTKEQQQPHHQPQREHQLPCFQRMHPSFLLLLSCLILLLCHSEAFASTNSPFWGHQRVNSKTQTTTADSNKKQSKTIVCVLQLPEHQVNGFKKPPAAVNGFKKPPVAFNGMISATAGTAAAAVTAVQYVAETKLPTDIGQFQLRAYKVPTGTVGQEPCVIYARDKPPFGTNGALAQNVPVRIHDQCLTSEVFGSQRCDCKEQLQMSLRYIQQHGGCIIYLQQEGRGIGFANKIAAYALQDRTGADTVDANLQLGFPEDAREYSVIPSILADMHIGSIQLMTNNPRKVDLLQQHHGVIIERTLPMVVPQANMYNRKYLETKHDRMNHLNFAQMLGRNNVKNNNNNNNNVIDVTAPRKRDPATPGKAKAKFPHIFTTETYITNGTDMTANAVHVALMAEKNGVMVVEVDEEEKTQAINGDDSASMAGVKAAADGYCLGRQSVEDAIAAIARGEMVVVVDDMDRENEGDLIMAASHCTDRDMARIVRYSSGVICVAMEEQRMIELDIPPMVQHNQDPKGTAFGVSVDATRDHGITTGISAGDRATTVRILADSKSTATDLNRPGHIFPLRARPGGVLTRDGHTEAAVDLSRLAGLPPCGVLCEIVSEDNPVEMMRLPELQRFCQQHGLVMTSIVDLKQYRRDTGL